MGKIARFACILVPMLCSTISLLLGIMMLMSGTNKNLTGLRSFYQLRIYTKNMQLSDSYDISPGSELDPKIKTGLADHDIEIEDFYYMYLFNYCSGEHTEQDDKQIDTLKECQKPEFEYVFDIEKIIKDHTEEHVKFPEAVQKAQKTVNIVARFMVTCYVIAVIGSGMTFFLGWIGLFSRWGSCLTTIFAGVSCSFFFIASCCSTGLSYTLLGALNKAFKDFKVEATVGRNWMALTWVGTAFAFTAVLFWMLSSCCCSGQKSKLRGGKPKSLEKIDSMTDSAYSYERIGSPYSMDTVKTRAPSQVYVSPSAGPLEPMRHAEV